MCATIVYNYALLHYILLISRICCQRRTNARTINWRNKIKFTKEKKNIYISQITVRTTNYFSSFHFISRVCVYWRTLPRWSWCAPFLFLLSFICHHTVCQQLRACFKCAREVVRQTMRARARAREYNEENTKQNLSFATTHISYSLVFSACLDTPSVACCLRLCRWFLFLLVFFAWPVIHRNTKRQIRHKNNKRL